MAAIKEYLIKEIIQALKDGKVVAAYYRIALLDIEELKDLTKEFLLPHIKPHMDKQEPCDLVFEYEVEDLYKLTFKAYQVVEEVEYIMMMMIDAGGYDMRATVRGGKPALVLKPSRPYRIALRDDMNGRGFYYAFGNATINQEEVLEVITEILEC